MIADWQRSWIETSRRPADEQLCFMKRIRVRCEHFVLHRNRGEPIRLRISVPFAPVTEQAKFYKTNTRVTVVTATKRGNKVCQRLIQEWVFIIRTDT